MSSALLTPFDLSFERRVLFGAEIVDAVTLLPVKSGIKVTATGLDRKPSVNYDGMFVWCEEGASQPLQVIVNAQGTPYESVAVAPPVPPERLVHIELAPAYAYPFPSGATGLRGRLIENAIGDAVAVSDGEVTLQWIDDAQAGTVWMDSPVRSHSAASGDFAAVMRFAPSQAPRALGKGIAARLCVTRGADTRHSSQFTIKLGSIGSESFAWSDLTP